MPETTSRNDPEALSSPCSPLERIALLVNPTAGLGRGVKTGELAQEKLRSQGVQVSLCTTNGPGDATRLARELAQNHDAIFALGGDGTINEVAAGLLDAPDTALGIIPTGTANVLAHELGFPTRNPLVSIDSIADATSRMIDVATADDQLVLTVCGAGLESLIVKDVMNQRKKVGRGGMARFIWPTVREFFTYFFHAGRFSVTVDGKLVEKRATSFVVSNTRIYGGFMSVTPNASLVDGRLQICSRRHAGVFANIMGLITAVMWVHQPRILASYSEGSIIEITSDREIPLQIDGDNAPFELGPEKPLTIRVLPKRLRVLLPREEPFPIQEPAQ